MIQKEELIRELGCLQVPILHLQHSCNAIFFCWHPHGQASQHFQNPCIFRHPVPCQSFPSVPPPAGNTQLLPTSLVTFGNTLYFLLSFLFSWPGTGLASTWLWDLGVVIDCLAGKTRQLAVELLQQFVTTKIYSSPQCHKIYRNINLGGVYCFVKFFDQQVWKLCGWQNTDVHPHKLTVWSQ